jgi:dolichyl-phosphate-mannose-protein mannosyltransferase
LDVTNAPVVSRAQQARFVVTLLLVGLFLHFFRLDQPAEVVFDEVHFGSFADAYCCSGEYFFDVHPPHGKLLAALGLKLGGYEGGQSFTTIGTPLSHVNPFLLRFIPALAGSLIPLLIFAILIQLGASSWAAFLAGWAVLFDNALLLQTRVLALEGTLLLGILAATSLALAARKPHRPLRQILLCLAAGACVGVAVGTKFTGLTAAFLVAIILLAPQRPRGSLARSIVMCGYALTGALVTYLGGWVLHFALLDRPGPGDIFGTPGGDLLRDIVDIHRTMFAVNHGLTATHPNASAWWSWPWMWRPLYYYAGNSSAIYFIGNPVVWWGTAMGVLFVLWRTVRQLFERKEGAGAFWSEMAPRLLPLVGFLAAYLPYIFIPRVLFLYHYLPALMFAICAIALWLDPLELTRPGRFSDQAPGVRWLFLLIPIGFLIMSPLTYGFTLPEGLLSALVQLIH